MKLLTLNIGFYGDKHGAWQERKPLILDALREHAPDVVALQAVALDPERGEHQAAQLTAGYPHVIFEPATVHPDGRQEGLAVLSRVPISEVRTLKLSLTPGCEDQTSRVLLHVKLDAPSGPLRLFNAHFSWVEAQGQDNVAEALPFLAAQNGPAVLVGDFNMTPDAAALDGLRAAGWRDAWAEKRPGEDGFTFVEKVEPSIRIDYAWTRDVRVNSVQVVLQDAQNGVRASDHAGLLVGVDW